MFFQNTIQSSVELKGIGLHTGKEAYLAFHPAPENTGIHIQRSDLPNKPSLPVSAQHVQATNMATTIGGDFFRVSTVEHCLSAVTALQIDNIIIEVRGPEIPVGDGSALMFWDALNSVGVQQQSQPKEFVFIKEPFELTDGDKWVKVKPYNGLKIECTIDFEHPAIGLQKMSLDLTKESFKKEILKARTFGFLKDAEALKAAGLALGGSLDNAIIMDDEKVMNPGGLRYSDEFVRHKILDAIGDLATLGRPILAHFEMYKSGHDLLNKLIKKILANPDLYSEVKLGEMN